MTIGVISAMDSEHRQLAERLQEKKVADYGNLHYVEGMLGSNRVILTQCGIGKVNAAVGATELIRRFAPDCIVSTGVAGGIDACLKVTDVVASDSLAYHDVWCGDGNEYGQVQGLPAVYKGCAPLLEHALSLNKTGLESRQLQAVVLRIRDVHAVQVFPVLGKDKVFPVLGCICNGQ